MNRSRMILLALVAALAMPAAAHAAKPKRQLYVSVGDSYASGFQPTGPGKGANTRNGFAYQVPKLAAARGYDFKLVNFGCGGRDDGFAAQREGLRSGGARRRAASRMAAARRSPPPSASCARTAARSG